MGDKWGDPYTDLIGSPGEWITEELRHKFVADMGKICPTFTDADAAAISEDFGGWLQTPQPHQGEGDPLSWWENVEVEWLLDQAWSLFFDSYCQH